MNVMNNLYAFILGRETKIALLELESVLRSFCFCSDKNNPEVSRGMDTSDHEQCRGMDFSILSVTGNVAIIKMEANSEKLISNNYGGGSKISDLPNEANEAKKLMKLLGGTIKIFEIVGEGSNNLIDDIAKIVLENTKDMSGKLNLGISDYRNLKIDCHDRGRSRNDNMGNINKIGLSVKNILKKSHNTRFVALKEGNELASIVSYKNKLDSKGIEIGLFNGCHSDPPVGGEESQSDKSEILRRQTSQDDRKVLLGRLVAVTNPEEWGKRDYDKPRGDKYSGMTPPKLARALVNIALLQTQSQSSKLKAQNCGARSIGGFPTKSGMTEKNNLATRLQAPERSDGGQVQQCDNCVVVDPFCGSGNILMEAAMLGCGVIGSDISKKAVDDTRANLDWLTQNFQLSISNFQSNYNYQFLKTNEAPKGPLSEGASETNNLIKLFQADATRYDFSQIFKPNEANPASEAKTFSIVTEPYLGQPKKFKPSMNAAKGEYQKVKKIYIDFLRNIMSCHPERMRRISNKDRDSSVEDSFRMTMCIIFPLVETQEGEQYSLLNESIDEIREMGYTLICNPMIYGREYQVVKRQIAFFKIQ